LECRVNLIAFHAIENTFLKGASEKSIIEMRDYLSAKGITTTIRASRGEDILAACGLLTTKKLMENGQ
jgi:23S rRNA (adenine2503-C2)-methyltransferase